MNPERYQKIKQLFMAALPLAPAERAAFLDQACGDDADLRAQVDDIFKYHDPATVIEPGPDRGQLAALAECDVGGVRIPVRPPDDGAGQYRMEPLAAGTVIAGRYRIVDLLGRGGMGQVYRADDLTLGHPVALKFLPGERVNDPVWLARFREEVRLARRVTHANVCRVHDMVEANGAVFISMEYIDGEDLRSLLRRIGRLPQDKALEVARQLCAGLAAAHEQGVLHRDLKPANIMLDGAGQVKITDFGIASLAPRSHERLPIAGTPAYIAPEVLAGRPPSLQSDIYSLGLVFYAMVTGAPAFAADSFEQRLSEPAPASPAKFVPDMDASFCRLIVQCLHEDPAGRPHSVYAVAAGLPGADPLLIALTAGHTPSPDTVAAAAVGQVRPRAAWWWFAGTVTSLVAVVFLAQRTFLLPEAGLPRAPAVLEEQARQVIHDLERTDRTQGRAHGFVVSADPGRNGAAPGRPASIYFEYRQGERWSSPRGPLEMPALLDLAWPVPGQRLVRLDPRGRLLLYRAEPPAPADRAADQPALDWSMPFRLAGLDWAAFQAVSSTGDAEGGARHLYWLGPHPDDPSRQVRVQAAADGPRVVLFRVTHAGSDAVPEASAQRASRPGDLFRFGIFLALLAGGAVLAWRNLKHGQVDQRGAWRLAVFMLAASGLLWFVASGHSTDPAVEAGLLVAALRFGVLTAAATWVFYIALDPHVRRFWPQSIIAWSRLLLGRVRDPLVGRDLLVGVAAGIGNVLIQQVSVLLAGWTGVDPAAAVGLMQGPDLGMLTGFADAIRTVSGAALAAVWSGLGLLLLLLLSRLVLGRPALAAWAFFLVAAMALTVTWGGVQSFPWLTGLAVALVLALVLTQAGLLAGVVSLFTMFLLVDTPLTWNTQAWYAGSTAMALVILSLLLVFGLHSSLMRRTP